MSYYELKNFGDRLGYHMINALLPPLNIPVNLFWSEWAVLTG